jgi:hypothetical protein
MTTVPLPPDTGSRLSWLQVAPLSVVSHGPVLPYWVSTACWGVPGAMVRSPPSVLGPTGSHRLLRLFAGVTSKPLEPMSRCPVDAVPLTDTLYAPAWCPVTSARYQVPWSSTAVTVVALPCGGVTVTAGGPLSAAGLETKTVEWPSLGSGEACTISGRATSR